MDDADLDRLAELAACMVGGAAAELIARVLPRRDGEELPDLRNRLARAAMRLRTGPTIVATDADLPVTTWLARLPIADRVLITLRYGEHLTPAEVARILDRPRPDVEARLSELVQAVPPPAVAYLAYGLDRLIASAPSSTQLAHAAKAAARRTARWHRGIAMLLGIALILAISAGLGISVISPGRWHAAGWQLTHRVDPPPGWRFLRVEVSRWDESTWLGRGSDECRVTKNSYTYGPIGPNPLDRAPPSSDPPERDIRFDRQQARLTGSTRLEWWPAEGVTALVTCTAPGDTGRLIAIAQSVRFEHRSLRIPVGIRELPLGVQLLNIDQAQDGTTWLSLHRIYFTVVITPPRAPVRDSACGPPAPVPHTPPPAPNPPPVHSDPQVEQRLLATPTVPVCAEVRWVAEPDRANREHVEDQLEEIGQQLVVSSDPSNPATWFDARDVLPPRSPR